MSPAPSRHSPGSFRCPACRARQELQTQCRRCGADLGLLVQAHRRIEFLLSDPTAEHQQELVLLAPNWTAPL